MCAKGSPLLFTPAAGRCQRKPRQAHAANGRATPYHVGCVPPDALCAKVEKPGHPVPGELQTCEPVERAGRGAPALSEDVARFADCTQPAVS
jgi:hypothetical protein